MASCPGKRKPFLEGGPTADGEDDLPHGAFATFSGGDERGFWGSTGRPGESGSSFGRRPYRNEGFRSPVWDHPAAHCTHLEKKPSAARDRARSAAGGRSGVTTPRGFIRRTARLAWAVLAKFGDAIRLGCPARRWLPAGIPGCLKNRKPSAPPKGPRDKPASC